MYKYKKHFLTFLIVILLILGTFTIFNKTEANDAVYEWAKSIGSTGSEQTPSFATDSEGNVYITGSFNSNSQNIDFDPGPGVVNLTSNSIDIYIIKLDSSGDFVWVKQIEDSGGGSEEPNSITVDSNDNIYITGSFSGVGADFDPGIGTAFLDAFGNRDAFILKLNSDGEYVWAKQISGPDGSEYIYGDSIKVDSSGNVYTVGNFRDTTIDLNPGIAESTVTSTGSIDIFISKLDSNGNYVWGKSFGSTTGDSSDNISIDSSGNIYIVGRFENVTDFNPGVGVANLSPIGGADVYILKIDSSGNFAWVKQIGGISYEYTYSIALDSSDNIYVTGYFYDTVDFDPGAGTVNLTSTGWATGYILKLNSNGDYVWVKQINGDDDVYVSQVAVDSSDNIYATGQFFGTADFDLGVDTVNLISSGSNDIFVLKLDLDGEYIWVKQIEIVGMGNDSDVIPINLDLSNNIYITGFFQSTVDFDPGAGTANLTSAGSDDIFLLKLLRTSAPSLTTSPATYTERSTTTLNGEITSTGGANPTIRGFNYGLDTNYGTNTTENGSFSTGTYTSNLTDLDCNTTYHYRAYATNSVGTSYGSDSTFTTASCPNTSGSYPRSSPYVSTPQVTTPTIPTQQPTTPTQPSSTPIYTRTLKLTIPRMIGDDVKSLQEFLNSKGYTIPQTSYQITLNLPSSDGIYGPKTKEAVIKFQIDNNLVPDGIFGQKTRAVINKLAE